MGEITPRVLAPNESVDLCVRSHDRNMITFAKKKKRVDGQGSRRPRSKEGESAGQRAAAIVGRSSFRI